MFLVGPLLLIAGHKAAAEEGVTRNSPFPEVPSQSIPDGGPKQATVESRNTGRKDVEEVIVTAQKRSERLQDVPVPVTAISGATLGVSNLLRLQDYQVRIPGFSMTPGIAQQQLLSIRGVTTGTGTNPTVGVAVDDIPYGSTSNLGGGNIVPDIDPSDLARVEVLRGPQGTLYGANSMGGLLKFVMIDPSTDRVSGRAQAGAVGVYNGSKVGHNVRGAINVPLSDTVAIRASAFGRNDPGYVDDPVSGKKGVNSADAHGGRFSALWMISEAFSLKIGAFAQRTKGDGRADVDFAVGDLQQVRLPGTGRYDKKVQVYSATLAGDLGNPDVTAVTGYSINSLFDNFDFGSVAGPTVRPVFGTSAAILTGDNETSKFTQEIRASFPIGKRVEWLVGAFYTDEDRDSMAEVFAADPTTGAAIGRFSSIAFPTTYKEYAAFTNITFHISDRLDLQVGGRGSENEQSYRQTNVDVAGTAVSSPIVRASDHSSTYVVTPRFRMSPNLMVYARVASGYRPGGVNFNPGPGSPLEYEADTTRNYEVGIKGDIYNHALSFDASTYYIDWRDIQIPVTNPITFAFYNTNGGKAKSQGAEFSVETRTTTGLTMTGWLTFNDARLTETLPTNVVRALSGDTLPYSSRWSSSISADQEFSVTSNVSGSVGASVSYVGDRKAGFRGGNGLRQDLPAYTQVDFRAEMTQESWKLDFFVTNLTDKRSPLYGGLGGLPPTAFNYIRPRTIGMNISKAF